MRFLHAADLHLGMRVTRFGSKINGRVQEARFEALDRLVNAARQLRLDFVLIAGDLFDDNHVDAAAARRAWKILDSIGPPVYVLPGNHDPLTADSVYHRPPWRDAADSRVRVLRTPEPVPLPGGGTLFPCPLVAKYSLNDPTRWIPERPPGDDGVRIGVAHGSLNDRPNLPPDDHLIGRHAADAKGLDYLALGHWHSPYQAKDRAGIVRTVYPGVHEPMRFRDCPDYGVGWTAYSNAAGSDLFTDDGRGRALFVAIDAPGAPPHIEEVDTGVLQWIDETCELNSEEELADLISRLALRPRSERESQLLRLHLKGTLPARAMQQIDELHSESSGGQTGVLHRFLWHELDLSDLHVEPSDAELQELAGDGILRAVYERLRGEAAGPRADAECSAEPPADSMRRQAAREALLVLYRLALEVRR